MDEKEFGKKIAKALDASASDISFRAEERLRSARKAALSSMKGGHVSHGDGTLSLILKRGKVWIGAGVVAAAIATSMLAKDLCQAYEPCASLLSEYVSQSTVPSED